MVVPAFDALLEEFDQDTHQARVSRLARLGRDERGTVQLAELLDQLTSLGGYWHELAIVAAVSARDGQRVLVGVTDLTAGVRSFAWSHLVEAGVDVDAVLGAVLDASTVDRGRLIGVIRQSGRHDLAEQLLLPLRARYGDREAAKLLLACQEASVVDLLAELDYAVANWEALAHRHAGPVLAHLEAQLRAAPRSQRDRLWRMAGPGAAVATETRPEQMLGLLEELGPSGGAASVLGPRLGLLIRAFPSRTVSLLLQPRHRGDLARRGIPQGVLANADFLPEADRLALARAVRENHGHFARFLARFPPSQREVLFRATYADVETGSILWPEAVLEALPHTARAAEAARMLTLREVIDRLDRSLWVTSFLPIAQARPQLQEALSVAKAEERAVAYRLLVDCTRRSRSPAELDITIATLRRLKNEQDPVRLAAITALARVPPRLFDDEHLPGLAEIITTVVEARDSSPATIERLRHLMLRFVALRAPPSPAFDFALASLDRLAGPTGTIAFGRHLHNLPADTEQRLVAALLPRLRRDADHDRFDLTLSLASALGRRAWDLDDLQALLARATRAPLERTARQGIDLWLASPRTRADRVGQLVGADPSTLTVPAVLRTVTSRRQDLLDVLLRPAPAKRRRSPDKRGRSGLKGRFLSGDVRYVPVITAGVSRWLPRQHRSYAEALHELIADPATKTWTSTAAIGALARIPVIGADELARYETSADVAKAEAALAGLAWTDNAERQLPRLLSFADTDRARVAVYAAARAARFTRPDALAAALDTVLDSHTSKVTARKEIVRLLALHRPTGALDRLLNVTQEPETHRDVRIAVGRSLRAFLDDDRTWPILSSLAEAGPDEARSLLDTAPFDIAARHRTRFAALTVTVASHPDLLARAQALALLASWNPWSTDAVQVAADHIADLDSGPSWRQAAASLVSIYGDENGVEQTHALLGHLAIAPTSPDHDAGAERDLPGRQRLGTVIRGLANLPADQRSRLRFSLIHAADQVATNPTMLDWQVELMLCAIDLAQPTDILQGISDLLAARPVAAAAGSSALQSALVRDRVTWQPDDLIEAFNALTERDETGAALLGLALLAAAGPASGWSEPWRARLRSIRSSANQDVAAAALGVATALE